MDEYIISEENVKKALTQFAAKHCFYGPKQIENMLIVDIEMKQAYIYTLQTVIEQRDQEWKQEPYDGSHQVDEQADEEESMTAWDMAIQPPATFENSTMQHIVPSSEVKLCDKCKGEGQIACVSCSASNNATCHSCNGTGKNKCKKCTGAGKLKWYLQINASWTTHTNTCIINEIDKLPNRLVKKSKGEKPRIDPVNNFLSADRVKEVKNGLVEKQKKKLEKLDEDSRISKQNHEILAVPVAKVQFENKCTSGFFYVYGMEHSVYFPKYPGGCKYCSIL